MESSSELNTSALMWSYRLSDNVRYVCNCGELCNLSLMYYCKHCTRMCCTQCVDIDAALSYCSSCFQDCSEQHLSYALLGDDHSIALSTTDTIDRLKCEKCLNCPKCISTSLITKAVQMAVSEGSEEKKKCYYVICQYCTWSSRDSIDFNETNERTNIIKIPPNQYQDRIKQIHHYLKNVTKSEAKKESLERYRYLKLKTLQLPPSLDSSSRNYQKKKNIPKISLEKIQTFDSETLLKLQKLEVKEKEADIWCEVASQSISLEEIDSFEFEFEDTSKTQLSLTAAEDKENFEQMTANCGIKDLAPIRRPLMNKLNKRCSNCLHQLIKYEFTNETFRFKIHLCGRFFVPSVKLVKVNEDDHSLHLRLLSSVDSLLKWKIFIPKQSTKSELMAGIVVHNDEEKNEGIDLKAIMSKNPERKFIWNFDLQKSIDANCPDSQFIEMSSHRSILSNVQNADNYDKNRKLLGKHYESSSSNKEYFISLKWRSEEEEDKEEKRKKRTFILGLEHTAPYVNDDTTDLRAPSVLIRQLILIDE
ncbi:hypothetical protein SNEBB_006260 [Seison nebaliae]|nr:hypothetical protein SNEBB_006260 [Seison nebaliae]